MGKIVGLIAAALLLAGVLALKQNKAGSEAAATAYMAEIIAEREAADLDMLDKNYSQLAMTHLLVLGEETVSIGSDPGAKLTLIGPNVAGRHAEVVVESTDSGPQYTLQALEGQLFVDGEEDAEITALALEVGGPRIRIGEKLLYYVDSHLGGLLRVLDYDSPAYTRFEGLDYYPVDPDYRVEAKIQPYDEPQRIEVIDTMGFTSDGWIYGVAEFELQGETRKLKMVLFTPEPTSESVFYIMFADKTSGRETYGAGRYLMPNFTTDEVLTLDFNRSVNPSCAYNSGYACPLPPAGNRFDFEVMAGIRDYEHRPPR